MKIGYGRQALLAFASTSALFIASAARRAALPTMKDTRDEYEPLSFGVSALFSVASVWVPGLESLSGFAWLLGALFGGVLHYGLMRNQSLPARAGQPAPLG